MSTEDKRRGCIANHRLSKSSMLAMLGDPAQPGESHSDSKSRAFYEKIPDANWEIISFNPLSRMVCVKITDRIGTRTTSVVLPYLTVDGLR